MGGALSSRKRKRLESVVAAIQQRWGTKALHRVERTGPGTQILHISTGFPNLDKALAGIGGIPRGRLTEFLGTPTSGMATLALKIIANAQAEKDRAAYFDLGGTFDPDYAARQAEKDRAAYFDLGGTFDPDYAARCHINLSRLFIVRPQSGPEALEITRSLIASRGLGVLVFDSVAHLLAEPHSAQRLSAALRQLPPVLAQSSCACIFLTPLSVGGISSPANYPSNFALPHYATIRLLLAKERWLYKGADVRGYEARVEVIKNELGPAGRKATIAVTFNGLMKGDGT
ncbi:MAG: hypothetical protein DPW09_45150 [Anaerolineae bacterium]|nr:hypothetical protein [Anaerolineae bacterium]